MSIFNSNEGYVRKNAAQIEVPKEFVQPKTLSLSKKSIVMAIVIILVLVIGAIVLTQVLPRGAYDRVTDADGNVSIVDGSYKEDSSLSPLKWWQAILAPFMILNPAEDGSTMVWAILALLFVIGAIFTALDKTGIMVYMVESLRNRFGKRKYLLLFILPFSFMFLGSTAGMFEELIPLTPVVVMLSYAFGWDALVGLGISVLAACFGFSAGVANPFTIGVSQSLIGLPIFSGIEARILTFVLAYLVLMLFIFPYAKKIEKKPQKSLVYLSDFKRKKDFNFDKTNFVFDKNKSRALQWFAGWLLVIVFFAIISIFIQPKYTEAVFGDFALADYVLYITVAIYVIAGIGACLMCGLKGKSLLRQLGKGLVTLAPAVAMILIAGGVRYIIVAGNVMDTILYKIIALCTGQSPVVIILLIYAAVFIFEIFIPSGSAKAFLLMPMIGAMCQTLGVHPQVAVLTLAFGDGFANVLLPTNAGLLLILGMTSVSYPKWFRWSGKIQLFFLMISVGLLMLSQFVIFA